MECAWFPNNGPMMTSEPHRIPGYMGCVPQYKYNFGNTFGIQTNRLFLDPCVQMRPRSNPIGSSYVTACPFRCNLVYRVCEPVISTYDGHVPGEQFIPGQRRGVSTRNALKYMTYRV